jgi:hypothetical protein
MTLRYTSAMLRRELNTRARDFARSHNLLHDLSPDDDPILLFGHNPQSHHGNFHPASWAAICANPSWARRLTKPHTAYRRSRTLANWPWKELDSASSSDALLMTIFCYPQVFNGTTLAPAVAALLGVDPASAPCFGINPRVPLHPNPKGRALTDRTEIDLQLNDLFVEAKLTETNFQNARPALIHRYRDLETVFDTAKLPRAARTEIISTDIYPDEEPTDEESTPIPTPNLNTIPATTTTRTIAIDKQPFQGYQLIRNVLAAFAANASFCVLSDARRQDLIETWHAVAAAVHHPGFTWRLKLLTWQELATALPTDLQDFLDAKYGITPA